MYPFENDRNRRGRKDPFDFFGMDDDFERMFREMERMMERAFRDFSFDWMKPGKSFVHGFNIHIGPDGKPKIREFGHRPSKTPKGEQAISDEREPLTDVIESDEVFTEAAYKLSELTPDKFISRGIIYPPFKNIREISAHIALVTTQQIAQEQGTTLYSIKDIKSRMWKPQYHPIIKTESNLKK